MRNPINTHLDIPLDESLSRQDPLGGAATRLRAANWYRLGLTLLLALSAALYLRGFNFFQVGVYTDDAAYVHLARSLAEGQTFWVSLAPGSTSAIYFPFGWPLLLAPIYAFSAGNLQTLKLIPLLLTLVNTALVALGWSTFGFPSRWWGLAVAALFAFAPVVTDHARMLMSEPAFTCVVLVGLLLTSRVAARHAPDWAAAALGVAWMFQVSIRSIGIVAIVASVLYLLYRRKAISLVVASMGCALAFALVVLFTPLAWSDLRPIVANPGYIAQTTQPLLDEALADEAVTGEAPLMLLVDRVGVNAVYALTSQWRDLLVPFLSGPALTGWLENLGLAFATVLAGSAVPALMLLGYGMNLRRAGLRPAHVFVPLYVLTVLVWPWYADRFLYPVLPFFFLYLLEGGLALLRAGVRWLNRGRLMPRLTVRVASLLFVLLLSLQVARSTRIDASVLHAPDLQVGAAWIQEHAEPDAVVIAPDASSRALYFKRAAVELTDPHPIESLLTSSPLYALIAPEIIWDTPARLEYTAATKRLLADLETGAWHALPVFEDAAARVRIYHLSP